MCDPLLTARCPARACPRVTPCFGWHVYEVADAVIEADFRPTMAFERATRITAVVANGGVGERPEARTASDRRRRQGCYTPKNAARARLPVASQIFTAS
jgi:hypothetical protein